MKLDTIVKNPNQISRIANQIKDMPKHVGHNFYSAPWDSELVLSDMFPSLDHPNTSDFFFAVGVHQFSFWTMKDGKYHKPLVVQLDGKPTKGSDYLWKASMKIFKQDPEFFTPGRQANMYCKEFGDWFSCDDGKCEITDFTKHFNIAQDYGHSMQLEGLTPKRILELSNSDTQSLKQYFRCTDRIAGYNEDPLAKKAMLTAMILNNRPEEFLKINDPENERPIIDYHCLRFALRTGCVDSGDYRDILAARQEVPEEVEERIRKVSYDVFLDFIEQSGRTLSVVDGFAWTSRKYCPEMTEPECNKCAIDDICAHDTQLFQPVYKSTFY